MKTTLNRRTFTRAAMLAGVTLSLLAAGSSRAEGTACAQLFSTMPNEAQWRKDITNPSAQTTAAPTDAARERAIETEVKFQANYIETVKDTPELRIFVGTGVVESTIRPLGRYGSGEYLKIGVARLGAGGVLKATLVLPVSGHTGLDNARKWALTDTFTIKLRRPDGTTVDLVADVKSRGLVTVQELEIPLVPGQIMALEYHRSGSGGPGGYIEGRRIDITWDGT